MSKPKTILFTGRKYATLVFVAKHKGAKSMLRIHGAAMSLKNKQPVPPEEYKKKDALITLKFENRKALETFMLFLGTMRDTHVFEEGIGAGMTISALAKEDPQETERAAIMGLFGSPEEFIEAVATAIRTQGRAAREQKRKQQPQAAST